MHTLVSLAFSHYVDTARFALDRGGIAYQEHRYMPVFSSAAVAWASRGKGGHNDRVSTRFSSPYLITEAGEHVPESAAIVRWAGAQSGEDLVPDAEVAELVQRFHDRVGPHTRRIVYFYCFQDPAVLCTLADRNVSPRQARAFRLLYPLLARFIGQQLRVDEEGVRRSEAVIEAEAEAVAERLADGRRYLCGDRFTAADLTFAALFSPTVLLAPDQGYGAHLPALDELPTGARELVERWRGHPAGAFAMRMYAEERSTR